MNLIEALSQEDEKQREAIRALGVQLTAQRAINGVLEARIADLERRLATMATRLDRHGTIIARANLQLLP